jgi:hypothetical protein
VSEVRPPKLQADELATLRALLQYTRESLVRKVEGVSDQDARRSFVGSDTTLLWLVKHVRMAETLWMCVRFADNEAVVPDDAVVDGDTVDGAVAAYRATRGRPDPPATIRRQGGRRRSRLGTAPRCHRGRSGRLRMTFGAPSRRSGPLGWPVLGETRTRKVQWADQSH